MPDLARRGATLRIVPAPAGPTFSSINGWGASCVAIARAGPPGQGQNADAAFRFLPPAVDPCGTAVPRYRYRRAKPGDEGGRHGGRHRRVPHGARPRRADRHPSCRRAGRRGPTGCAAGRARFLGPAAAPRAVRRLAHGHHPLHDRGRLPAVQFRRPGRQSRRLQRRSRANDLRGAQGQLHRPDAPLRHSVRHASPRTEAMPRSPRSRSPPTRGGAPISPIPTTGRPRASPPAATAAFSTPPRRRSRARRSRWSPARRTSSICAPCSPRPRAAAVPRQRRRSRRAAQRATSTSCSATATASRPG